MNVRQAKREKDGMQKGETRREIGGGRREGETERRGENENTRVRKIVLQIAEAGEALLRLHKSHA